MRRAEREVTDPAALDRILQGSLVVFLALRDEPAPYVLPVCFGYEDGVLYIHSARVGTKIDLISRDPMVGFSAHTEMQVITGSAPCSFSARAESVVGTGMAEVLTGEADRKHGLDLIMRHYGGRSPDDIPASAPYHLGSLARTCVIAVRVRTLRGKRTG
jgi:uncharacterized protein